MEVVSFFWGGVTNPLQIGKGSTHDLTHMEIYSFTGTYNTQQMHLFAQNWRIMDVEKKNFKIIPYTSSDKMFNIALKFEFVLTIFVIILGVSPQYQHVGIT